MAVARKKKKAKPQQESAAEALDEIEHRGDELYEWIIANPTPILAGGAVVLVLAAVWGFASSGMDSSRSSASAAIAQAKNEYRVAMGGRYGGSLDVPEPANPQAARETREEYVTRFQALADDYAGSEMGSYALVQVGNLQAELDDVDAALSSLQEALEPYGDNHAMRGILLERIALLHESKGDLDAASQAHVEASAITRYPLRYFALVNAARTQAEAGKTDEAIATFDRISAEAPDLQIPEHTQSMLLELKASRAQ
ncbi:MAG: tetratricopeptide repeat protein [Myxococcota bacterium]|nr:tetratricopeptide repeat protein [Myxococcota bacterium]